MEKKYLSQSNPVVQQNLNCFLKAQHINMNWG